jgi:hypothetical protein
MSRQPKSQPIATTTPTAPTSETVVVGSVQGIDFIIDRPTPPIVVPFADGSSKVVLSIGQASLTIRFVSHKTGREKILHLDRRVDAETAIESIL